MPSISPGRSTGVLRQMLPTDWRVSASDRRLIRRFWGSTSSTITSTSWLVETILPAKAWLKWRAPALVVRDGVASTTSGSAGEVCASCRA
jgi:hypothetical protein